MGDMFLISENFNFKLIDKFLFLSKKVFTNILLNKWTVKEYTEDKIWSNRPHLLEMKTKNKIMNSLNETQK